MNAPRGLEHPGARAGRGSCPKEQQGLARGASSAAFSPWGAPHTPFTTFSQPSPVSDCACLHQPAGAGALRTPGAPICALQIPRNVKLERGGVVGREARSWEPPIPLEI